MDFFINFLKNYLKIQKKYPIKTIYLPYFTDKKILEKFLKKVFTNDFFCVMIWASKEKHMEVLL